MRWTIQKIMSFVLLGITGVSNMSIVAADTRNPPRHIQKFLTINPMFLPESVANAIRYTAKRKPAPTKNSI